MRLALVVLGLTLSVPAWCQDWTGNALYALCEPQNEGAGQWYVKGFIDGYGDYDLNAAAQPYDGIAIFLCVPPQVTPKQTYDMMCKFLREHPEQRHFPASVLVDLH